MSDAAPGALMGRRSIPANLVFMKSSQEENVKKTRSNKHLFNLACLQQSFPFCQAELPQKKDAHVINYGWAVSYPWSWRTH